MVKLFKSWLYNLYYLCFGKLNMTHAVSLSIVEGNLYESLNNFKASIKTATVVEADLSGKSHLRGYFADLFQLINRLINFAPAMTEKNDKKKDSILDAAETLFAKWGYEGSSTRSIAAEAGVNMAMLNYYFGSKDGLYKAVLERRLSGFRQTLASIAGKKMSSWEKLKLAVDTYADRVLSNNCFHKIISRQLSLEQRSDMAGFIAENIYKNISQIKLIINEGINNGSFNKDIDVEMLVATIFGIKYYLVNSAPIASQLFDKNLQDPEIMAKEINPRVKTYLHNLLNVYLIKHDTEN